MHNRGVLYLPMKLFEQLVFFQVQVIDIYIVKNAVFASMPKSKRTVWWMEEIDKA